MRTVRIMGGVGVERGISRGGVKKSMNLWGISCFYNEVRLKLCVPIYWSVNL